MTGSPLSRSSWLPQKPCSTAQLFAASGEVSPDLGIRGGDQPGVSRGKQTGGLVTASSSQIKTRTRYWVGR